MAEAQSLWIAIAAAIQTQRDRPSPIQHAQPVGGGCINRSYRLLLDDGSAWFVKLNQLDCLTAFEAEAEALTAIAASQTIRVPTPIAWGEADRTAYLVLEWLDLDRGPSDWQQLGADLARLHRQTHSAQGFGWHRDNVIGQTAQINHWQRDWGGFWQTQRIQFQLDLAAQKGYRWPNAKVLCDRIPEILTDHQPQPVLVHGDLWSGNAGFLADGTPVIFDPATYYGDREVDLAMTELFGGFPSAFYDGYRQAWPIDAGYRRRRDLYNLYHVLNHVNLFGGGYAQQAQRLIDRLLQIR
ncbi:fructosamine kinase family protein [Synechococcus elongatus IITB4]|uniref:fructosamine kinase family protein n=1 Tax=Synechococcus elongatus TaxID=32046 RepID=UPI0030CF4D3E